MEDAGNTSSAWEQDSGAESVVKTVFILLFMFLGLFGNCLVVGCLLKNRTDRGKAPVLLTMNLCIVNILDCILNMTIILGTTLAHTWTYSDSMCQCHAFTIQAVNTEVTLGLTILTFDRFLAEKQSEQYQLSSWKAVGLILYTWIQTFSFCVPIIAWVIPSTLYQSKYLCSIDRHTPLIYVIFMGSFCFVIPLVMMTVFCSYIFRCVFLKKPVGAVEQRNIYSDLSLFESDSTKELHQGRYTFFIFILWFCLYVPFLTANFYELGNNSIQSISSESYVLNFELPSLLDTFVTWARFSFPAVFFLATFCRKGIRNNAKMLFTCRRNNSVVDLNSGSKNRSLERQTKTRLKINVNKVREKSFIPCKESPITPSTFQVPVLFATASGIHVQKFDTEQDITGREIYYTKTSSQTQDIQVEKAQKCDVLGSQTDLIAVEDDTSDYDSSSEVDRFSVSHPISSKMSKMTKTEVIHRSLSNPEVGRVKDNKIRPFGHLPVTDDRGVVPGDSGIDISSAAGNSISRRRRGAVMQSACVPEVEVLTETSLPSAVNSISSVVLAQASRVSSSGSTRTEVDVTPASLLEQDMKNWNTVSKLDSTAQDLKVYYSSGKLGGCNVNTDGTKCILPAQICEHQSADERNPMGFRSVTDGSNSRGIPQRLEPIACHVATRHKKTKGQRHSKPKNSEWQNEIYDDQSGFVVDESNQNCVSSSVNFQLIERQAQLPLVPQEVPWKTDNHPHQNKKNPSKELSLAKCSVQLSKKSAVLQRKEKNT